MPPKAKPGAKATAKPAAAKAKAASSPEPIAPVKSPGPEKLSVFDAETNLNFIEDDDWAALASTETPSSSVGKVLEALLTLLGDTDAANWATAATALEKPEALVREIRALGPLGCTQLQLQRAAAVISEADLGSLMATTGEVPPPKAKAPAKAKAKAKAAEPSARPPGAPAALALAQLVESYVARAESPSKFPMEWPAVPFRDIHRNLQHALHSKQHACLICCSKLATKAVSQYLQLCGAGMVNVSQLQVQVQLAKAMPPDVARSTLGSALKEALARGSRLALQLGTSPPNLRRFCDSQMPIEAFEHEKTGEVARTLGLEAAEAPNFQMVLLVEMSKATAEKALPQVLPGFDEMAVMLVDDATLPSNSQLDEASRRPTSLRSALSLLAVDAAKTAAPTAPTEAPEALVEGVVVNEIDFEYVEKFGEDWQERWLLGPSEQDESGKEIRKGLISAKLVKYPSNPKDAKMCLQLMGGAANAPCTGIWTSFTPLIRPTEVEFEFTVNGKVDMPNACVVFTEKAFEGALPDCKVGVQFTVRGGMQLCGGGGNLVRISNDGKIQNDKWNKVLIKIDWTDKIAVAQVDTRGKGYAPAIQTVPFRDPTCCGFGALFIYNTDTQATCWFSELRVKQDQQDMAMSGNDALDARRELAERMKQREYQMAVDADMEVGMKMGAIKSTTCHGMNLAMEQAANNSSGHALG